VLDARKLGGQLIKDAPGEEANPSTTFGKVPRWRVSLIKVVNRKRKRMSNAKPGIALDAVARGEKKKP